MLTVNNLNIERMLDLLLAEEVPLNIKDEWTDEDYGNYIIHIFDVFIVQTNWQDKEDTARIVYSLRKIRGQVWQPAYRS